MKLQISEKQFDTICENLIKDAFAVSAPLSDLEPGDRRIVLRDLMTEVMHRIHETFYDNKTVDRTEEVRDVVESAYKVFCEESHDY